MGLCISLQPTIALVPTCILTSTRRGRTPHLPRRTCRLEVPTSRSSALATPRLCKGPSTRPSTMGVSSLPRGNSLTCHSRAHPPRLHPLTLALALALALTRYGKKPVALSLGTIFHRSHLEIIASQVSEIAGTHAPRWSKRRRFEAAWELLEALRPSTSIPTSTLPLERAAEAYEQLDSNAAKVMLLSYTEPQHSRF